MEHFICIQCGTQFAETAQPPSSCPICTDERQFVHHGGQQWTTLKQLTAEYHNRFEDEAPQLLGIGTDPEFAIGQRALLLQSPGGKLLWKDKGSVSDGLDTRAALHPVKPLPGGNRAQREAG